MKEDVTTYTDDEIEAGIEQSRRNLKTFTEVAIGLLIAYAIMFGVVWTAIVQSLK